MALPVLIKAMERNLKTSEGAEGIMSVFSRKQDGSILDNFGVFFGVGVVKKESGELGGM